MILPIQHAVRGRLIEVIGRLYGIPADDPVLAQIAVEIPPRRALGDLAVPLAFELARRLRKAPRAIAQEIAGAVGPIDGIARVEAAPNGYVNLFIDRQAALTAGWPPTRRRRPIAGTARPSSSTPRSTRTRPRTSGIFGMPRSATRSAGCSASWAARSRSRTTSTTPASRSRTSRSDSASSKQVARRGPADRRRQAASTTTAGISTPASPSGTGGQGAAQDPRARRSTTSSTAATPPPTSRTSSPIGSSAAISGRCGG